MTDRNPRRLAVIAIVAVLVVVAVVLAFRLGRTTATPPIVTPNPTPSTSTSASPTPSYSPTDRQGSPEPGLETGPATAGEGGTTTGPAGLPLGYTRDRTGAANAATNYLMWMNSLRITDKATADAMAEVTADDDKTRSAMIASFDALRSGMANITEDQPGPARGAYAIAKYSQISALIYVWGPDVIAEKSGEKQQLWGITAVALVWVDGDWKLVGDLIAKVGGAAVDPLDPAGNPSAEEKHSILRRTPADPGDITDSADQTWFEYANAPH